MCSDEKDEWGREIFRGNLEVTAAHRITIPADVRREENVGEHDEYFLIAYTETGVVAERVRTSTAQNNKRITVPDSIMERYEEGVILEFSIREVNTGSSALSWE